MAAREIQIDWNAIHPWMKAAKDFAEANQGHFAVRKATDDGELTPEFKSWAAYFDKLGWAPWAFRRLNLIGEPKAQWTAPCQWPEWFTAEGDWVAKEWPPGKLPRGIAAE